MGYGDMCRLRGGRREENYQKERANKAEQKLKDLLAWAYERCDAEVKERPGNNLRKRVLLNTWNQIIVRLGGEPRKC